MVNQPTGNHGWESFGVVRFLQGQTRIAKPESAYNSLIIGPKRFGMVNQPIGNHGLGIFWCSDLTLNPSFKVKRG